MIACKFEPFGCIDSIMPIINSILDTDLYKFTTGYAYSKLFPYAEGIFRFIDRSDRVYPTGFDEKLREEINHLSTVALTVSEAAFIKKAMPYLPPTYVDFLKGFRFDPNELDIHLDEGGKLHIDAVGPLYRVTLWETPILALVSELYYRMMQAEPDHAYLVEAAIRKAELLKKEQITFSLFGMRRRFSYDVEDKVTGIMKEHAGSALYGTSNMHFAHKYDLKVSGTHPHEWIQFHGAIYGYKMANYMAMEDWISVYDGDLGTVLTDTYTTDVFLRNFSKKHALLFTSLRQDSGDPIAFIDKAIARYKELRVNPSLKYIIFSDSLDTERAIQIRNACKGRIGCTFGIGTNLTNDTGSGYKPSNIVMKLWRCRMTEKEQWSDCVKLSDTAGKHTGEEEEIRLAQATLGIDR